MGVERWLLIAERRKESERRTMLNAALALDAVSTASVNVASLASVVGKRVTG